MRKVLLDHKFTQDTKGLEVLPSSQFEMIRDFHTKFELEYDGMSRSLPDDYALFRLGFMIEELGEYANSTGYKEIGRMLHDLHTYIKTEPNHHNGLRSEERDMVNELDSLVDLVYVALGTAYLHGYDFDEAFARVHLANMKKIRVLNVEESTASTGRGSKYDVKKPEGWTPADLSDLVFI